MNHRMRSANTLLFGYFILFSLTGSVVFQLPFLYVSGVAVPYIDGLFTTVSALCVTGLSTVDMSVYTTAGFIALLFFIEAGGLGLVAFFTLYFVFPARKIALVERNYIRDYFISDVKASARQILFRIVTITVVIEAAGALVLSQLLRHAGEPRFVFYGIFLSISAFCNAGFAPYADSLERFSHNEVLCYAVAFLIIAGGLGFTVFNDMASLIRHRFFGKQKKAVSLHTKIVFFMTAFLIIAGTVFIFCIERTRALQGMPWYTAVSNAFFQAVTLRTAGFDTISQAVFSAPGTFISILLMIVGGSPGSMAGGLKTTTVFLLWCYTFRSGRDRGNISIFHRDIDSGVVQKAVGIIIKAFCVFMLSYFLLSLTEGASLRSGLFTAGDLVYEIVSAFGTVGVSKGVTPHLSAAGKMIIILTMLAGRTGIIALSTGALSRRNQRSVTDYPCEDVLVG
jgi:trk system potassium uptake protein